MHVKIHLHQARNTKKWPSHFYSIFHGVLNGEYFNFIFPNFMRFKRDISTEKLSTLRTCLERSEIVTKGPNTLQLLFIKKHEKRSKTSFTIVCLYDKILWFSQ